MLFVRHGCPGCPSAASAADTLASSEALALQTVEADTDDGLATAQRYNVLSTPTAILFSGTGKELGRARDATSLAALGKLLKAA
jgi:protein-disulfide isomerase